MDAAVVYARFAHDLKYEDIPAAAVAAAKVNITDTLASCIAGSVAAGVGETVSVLNDIGGKGTSTVIGYSTRVPPPDAALANGLMAHALDYDDTHDKAVLHAGCTVIPASFATAEYIGGCTGKEFITAVIAGIEVSSRMGMATRLGPVKTGWIYTPLYGYFSSTIAACRILKLDEEQTINAMGIVYSQAAGNQQGVYDGALTKRLQAGLAARAGVLSALMARKGFTGPRNCLEGKTGLFPLYLHGDYDSATLTAGLGQTWEIENLSYKPYTCCRLNHSFIDATLALALEHDIKAADVKSVTAYTGKDAFALLCEPLDIKRQPRNTVDSQFSLPYTISVAIARHKVTIPDFSPEAIKDPVVLGLAQKVTPKLMEELATRQVEPAIVEINMKDGTTYKKRVDYALGHPLNPMNITAKFRDAALFGAKKLSKKKVEGILTLINGLEEDPDARKVIRLLA